MPDVVLIVEEKPFFLDFAFDLPEGVELESQDQSRDSVTWGVGGSDDD